MIDVFLIVFPFRRVLRFRAFVAGFEGPQGQGEGAGECNDGC